MKAFNIMKEQFFKTATAAAALVAMLTSSAFAQGAVSGNSPKQAGKSPVKVFILAGQSNMQGQGLVTMKDKEGNEKPGTLVSMLKDPAKAPLLKHWVDANGDWAERRDDVWVYDVSERGSRHGVLEFGYGWNLGVREWFGPEMQFGHLLGNHFENQVLIITSSRMGRLTSSSAMRWVKA